MNVWKKLTFALGTVLLAASIEASAQVDSSAFYRENFNSRVASMIDSVLTVNVYYPLLKTDIYGDYIGNEQSLTALDSLLRDRDGEIAFISIFSAASPEGPYALNTRLATDRANALEAHILENYPEYEGRIVKNSTPESWNELRAFVEKDGNLSEKARTRILNIIDSPAQPDAKERTLKAQPEYRQLFKTYFPRLRFAYAQFDMMDPVQIEDNWDIPEDFQPLATDMAPIEPWLYKIQKPIIAVSTNLLYDALITPNFAVELPIGHKWSLYGEYTFPWWLNKANDRAWEMLKWDLGGRYWLSKLNTNDPMDVLRGHFVGLDLNLGYYDIEPKHTGYQGEFASVSLEYGYAWKLSTHWRLDAFLGLGYMFSQYRYYEGNSDDTHLLYQHTGNLNWFGPTKVGASIKYIFTKTERRATR